MKTIRLSCVDCFGIERWAFATEKHQKKFPNESLIRIAFRTLIGYMDTGEGRINEAAGTMRITNSNGVIFDGKYTVKKTSPGAQPGNQNAAKPDDEKRTSILAIPVTRREKARLVHDAKGEKLSVYVRRKLGMH